MKKLGNVYTDNASLKVADHLGIFTDFSKVDRSLPTMIVGYDLAKGLIKDFFINTRGYKDQNLWWTFRRNMDRHVFMNDMANFSKMCLSPIIGNLRYENINVLKLSYSSVKRLMEFINKPKRKFFFIDYNKCIFIYVKEKNLILGLSLLTPSRFFNVKKGNIANKFFKNKYNWWIRDFDNIPEPIRVLLDGDLLQNIAVAAHSM